MKHPIIESGVFQSPVFRDLTSVAAGLAGSGTLKHQFFFGGEAVVKTLENTGVVVCIYMIYVYIYINMYINMYICNIFKYI